MRYVLAAIAAAILLAPVNAHAQASCDKCEHLCLWAPLLISAQKTQILYGDADVVGEATNVGGLEQNVLTTMSQWATKSDAETPCYEIIRKEYLGADDPNVILPDTATLDEVISRLPRTGNLFHVAHDKKGCPIEDNSGKPFDKEKLQEKMCPALVDAFLEHEKVHQKECQELWKKGGSKAASKFYANKSNYAQSEVRAYETQIRMMRESMDKLIQQKGCGVSSYSIKDFAPPPKNDEAGKKEAQDKAKNLREAMKKVNDYNNSRPK